MRGLAFMRRHHDDALRRMYGRGRPNALARALNRGWAIAASAGLWPRRLVTLEVPARRTGRVTAFPLVMTEHDGDLYLVAMLGEDANWVRNVREPEGARFSATVIERTFAWKKSTP
jgi:F420H(2)-dependent quinone reductase